MKTLWLTAFLLITTSLGLYAQSANGSGTTAPVTDQTDVPAPTAYQVTERGANHKVWQSETFEKRADGTIVPQTFRGPPM